MREVGARVIRLTRDNRIKQALAEYRRLRAGLGQFRARAGGASSVQTEVGAAWPLLGRRLAVAWPSLGRRSAATRAVRSPLCPPVSTQPSYRRPPSPP